MKKSTAALVVGGALGLGALVYAFSRRGIKVGLATGRHYILGGTFAEPGSAAAIKAGGLAVNLKIADGSSDWSADCAPTVSQLRGLGAPVSGWGWQSFTTPSEAQDQGRVAAEATRRLGLPAYYANCEAPVFGGEGYAYPDDPPGNVAAFVAGFRAGAPGVPLAWNGYSGANRLPPEVWRLFQIRAPMLYGSGGSSDSAKPRQKALERWTAQAAAAKSYGQAFEPYVSAGADDSLGGHWDFYQDRDGGPGIVTRVAWLQPSAVWVWYWGPSAAARMLTKGNATNEPIAHVAPALRDAAAAGKSWAGYPPAELKT